MPQIVEQPHPYLGRVYGNIVDQYATPTYNIRLYLLRDPQNRNTVDEIALQPTSPDANVVDGVILAQTGVTGTQIDEVRIKSFAGAGSSTTQTVVEFSIFQPGAADFIDQLNMARSFLGNPLGTSPTLFMEIVFKGYESDPDDADLGGAPAVIAGPFRYKLSVRGFSLDINSTGTRYDFDTVITSTLGYTDNVFRLPKDLHTTGSTIEEHAESLQEALNTYHLNASSDPSIANRFVIDVDALLNKPVIPDGEVSELDYITDSSLRTSAFPNAESQNRHLNEIFEIRDAVEARQQQEDAPTDSGNQVEQVFVGDRFNVPEDKTIHDYFLILLSMNPEFYKKVTRRQDFDDLASPIDHGQGYITWMRVQCDVREIGYDEDRKEVIREYTYRPVLYKTVRTDMVTSPLEMEYDEEDAAQRLRQILGAGMLYKSYDYIFTGQNDQVLDLDLNYNLGIAILTAPSGGTTGDSSVTNSTITAPRLPQTADPSPTGLDNFVKSLRNSVELSSLTNTFTNLGQLFSGAQDSLSQLANDAANLLGRDPAEISAALTDVSGQSAQELLGELDSRTIRQLNANLQITDPSATLLGDQGDPEIVGELPDGSAYTPESSNFIFASDFLNPENAPDLDQLLSRGYRDFKEDINKATDIPQKVDATEDSRSIIESSTYTALSPANRLLGYLVNQAAANQFFVDLTLTIRGDPWYLGASHLAGEQEIGRPISDAPQLSSIRSTPAAVTLERDDACFWFTMRSPRRFDPDWTDEDSELNSGFWRFDDVNRSMSGLYRIRHYECVLSGGVFTVEIQRAIREIPVNRIGNRPVVETTAAAVDNNEGDTGSIGDLLTAPIDPELAGDPDPFGPP